jgi:hypothetical protein
MSVQAEHNHGWREPPGAGLTRKRHAPNSAQARRAPSLYHILSRQAQGTVAFLALSATRPRDSNPAIVHARARGLPTISCLAATSSSSGRAEVSAPPRRRPDRRAASHRICFDSARPSHRSGSEAFKCEWLTMVRVSRRSWTPAQIELLLALVQKGVSPARASVILKRRQVAVQTKARQLGKSFPDIRDVRAARLARELEEVQSKRHGGAGHSTERQSAQGR